MKKIGIIPYIERDINYEMTIKFIHWICEKGSTPYIPFEVSDVIGFSEYALDYDTMYKTVDFIIALGGDGTLLGIARDVCKYNKPIIGINLGTLGFLTDAERPFAKISLENILNGKYVLEKRMMLEANIINENRVEQNYIGLNDVCITRGSLSRLINIKIYINDEYVDVFRGDGIIVSTPTGSTAYNLSAGGPILVPDSQMMVITPICPHSLYSRSFVVSGNDVIKVEFDKSTTNVMLSIDGQMGSIVNHNDVVIIKKSKYNTTIIKTHNQGFYKDLRKKIVGMEKE